MLKSQSEVAPGRRADRLRAILDDAFKPSRLEIVDDSSKHAGHTGATPAGETHFTVRIISDAFANRTRVERSRMVHAALDGEFSTGLHALSLNLSSPSE